MPTGPNLTNIKRMRAGSDGPECLERQIKGSRKMAIEDLKSIFLKMPANFYSSFVRNQHKKQLFTPSASFRPQLNRDQYYSDISYGFQ